VTKDFPDRFESPPSSKTLETDTRNVVDRILERADTHPDAIAFWIQGEHLSYGDMKAGINMIAACLRSLREEGMDAPVAIIADRSKDSYLAMLASLMVGLPFLPLHPKHPASRSCAALDQCESKTLVAGAESLATVRELLTLQDHPITLIWTGTEDPLEGLEFHRHSVRAPVKPDVESVPSRDVVAENRVAYILFTSGSTGTPKGVTVSHANLLAYVDAITRLYRPTPTDRLSQVFDQTFDLAMHDIFVGLSSGSSIYVVPEREQQSPGGFIRRHALTFWFSTPSTAALMQRVGALKPGTFPSIRLSLFCGEALPRDLADSWAVAAPNSRVENLYGPTEATIAITRFAIEDTPRHDDGGVVPIGFPFQGQVAALCGPDGEFIEAREDAEGELILSGSQVSLGYWRDGARTDEKFPTNMKADPEHRRWYRTGDLARYKEATGFHFLGRIDDQVKIRGHRVELAEIEIALKNASGSALVAAVAWPRTTFGSDGVVGFVCGSEKPEDTIRERCAALVPVYMVPRRVIILDEMPINTSGKIDRAALVAQLEGGTT
jgi:amino acid adenylation domain-containing protein